MRRVQKAIAAPANSTETSSSGAARISALKELAADRLRRAGLLSDLRFLHDEPSVFLKRA